MRDSEKILTELSKQAQNKDYQFERIYRILCNKNMYIKAYSNIYSNNGSAACGSDSKTADGFSEANINRIIEAVKDESYQANPVRRTYSKNNGKLLPLGISNFNDRLVQEICRMVLEAIYKPAFSNSSHGFRPNSSCHTALMQAKRTFREANWFIEGDIKGCFGKIDHQVLINVLRKRIKDERFLRLIWKFLKAGYIKNWQSNNTFSKTPQGGIVSPILANIYMNELDEYIESELQFSERNERIPQQCKIVNPTYLKFTNELAALKKQISSCINKELRQKLIAEHKRVRKLSNKERVQLGLKGNNNLQYVRYADNFIIAVLGSKEDCQNIKTKIAEYLRNNLKLALSEEKTLIIHARDKARFLNYEVQVRQNNKFFEASNGIKRRTGNFGITLLMPRDVMFDYINKKQVVDDINAEHWRGKARPFLQGLSDLEIVTTYNAEIQELYNYYSLAENVSSRMDMIYHVMEYSCLKTLAGKHKMSVAKVRIKYQVDDGWGVRYNTKKDTKIRFFYNQGFKMSSS